MRLDVHEFIVEARDDTPRPRCVVVRERTVLEGGTAVRDGGEGRAHAAGTHDQNPHRGGVLPDDLVRCPGTGLSLFLAGARLRPFRANGGRV